MKAILLSAAFLFLSLCLSAQPGTLDQSFGTKGRSVFTYGLQHYFNLIGGVVQKDDKIIAVGTYQSPFDNEGKVSISLSRFLPDGTYDTSFADSGRADLYFGFGYSEPRFVVQQPDGKILIAGYAFNSATQPVYYGIIIRVNPDGTPDESFGSKGIVTNSYTQRIIFNTLSLTADNRIVAAGSASGFNSVVSRYLPDGTPDASFGSGGNVTLLGGQVIGSALQPDGKIVVGGGTTNNGIESSFILARYTQSGVLDESFGVGGVVKTAYGGLVDQFRNIAIQHDNKIIASGSTSSDYLPVILRYNENGTIDSSFGNKGAVETVYPDASVGTNDIIVQPDDKLLCAGGGAKIGGIADFSLFQLNEDGTLDSSFGTNGKTLVDMGYGISDAARTAAFQSDGKLVLIGSSFDYSGTGEGPDYISLARFNAGKPQKPLLTRIERWLQHHGITWQGDNNVRYYTVQRSMDGGVTYQPLAKLYSNHQPLLTYEDVTAISDNAVYRLAVVARDGSRSFSNAVAPGSDNSVKVFPNPVRSTLQLQGLPTSSKSSITVTDFTGNVRTSTTATGSSLSINTSALKPGNYLLKVQSGNAVTTHTFVKE